MSLKGIVYKNYTYFRNLPFSMRIAAKTTNLDFIEVCTTNEKMNVRYTINMLKTKNWQEKLINKCAKIINSDIEKSLLKDKKSIFLFICLTIINFYLMFVHICIMIL